MTVDFLGIQYSYKNSQLVVWRKFEADKGYLHPFLVLKGKNSILKNKNKKRCWRKHERSWLSFIELKTISISGDSHF